MPKQMQIRSFEIFFRKPDGPSSLLLIIFVCFVFGCVTTHHRQYPDDDHHHLAVDYNNAGTCRRVMQYAMLMGMDVEKISISNAYLTFA